MAGVISSRIAYGNMRSGQDWLRSRWDRPKYGFLVDNETGVMMISRITWMSID